MSQELMDLETAEKRIRTNPAIAEWRNFEREAHRMGHRQKKVYFLNCMRKSSPQHRWYGYYLTAFIEFYDLQNRNQAEHWAKEAMTCGCPTEALVILSHRGILS